MTVTDVIGGPVDVLIPDDALDRALTMVAETATVGSDQRRSCIALTGRRSSGDSFPLEASVSCLDVVGDRSFTIIARDVTDRLRSEEALRTQAVSLAQNAAELRAAERASCRSGRRSSSAR